MPVDTPARTSTCRACGGALPPGGDERGQLCLGCLLEPALDHDSEAVTLVAEPGERPVLPAAGLRFAHYELDAAGNGFPVELGRGAMGVTYRATDTTLRCAVALKVIKLDNAAHPRARARFLREAQAAAALRHPHVASVFFFGEQPESGQLFYAMEWVDGETLQARVRRTGGLPVGAVLEIGAQVAGALAAAEARGLTHRDLKPANLMLVTGAGINVKVIDFGLAKAAAAAANATDPSLTRTAEFVGTPAFASPEQFDGGAEIDARSDFYALGVTLWYALTGHAPFAGHTLAEIHEGQLAVSLPLDQLRAAGVPGPLVKLLSSLLSPDPAGRPQTAAELTAALDVCKQTDAGRPGGGARRSWRGRELAAAVGALALGVGVLAVLHHRTSDIARENGLLQQQTLAQQQQLNVMQTQLQQQTQLIALVNAKIDRNVASVTGDPARSNPAAAAQADVARERGISIETLKKQLDGENVDVRQLLVQIEQRLVATQAQTGQWQRLKRQTLTRLGDGEYAAGHFPASVDPYQQALALIDADKEPLAWCDGARNLELALWQTGRYAEAMPLARQIANRRIALQGPEHPATLRALADQARLLRALGSFAESETLYRQVWQTQERTLGKENSETLITLIDLVYLLHYRGKDAESEVLGRRCLEACERTLGKENLYTLHAVTNLAVALYYEGNYPESAALCRRCLEARERLLGPDHPETLVSVSNLAGNLQIEGDLKGAEQLFRRDLEAQERALGPDHPLTLTIMHNLGSLLQDRGDNAGAESYTRRALEGRERVLRPDHPDTLMSLSNLAQMLDAKGDPAGAEPLYQQALVRTERSLPPGDAVRMDLEHYYSLFREKQGRLPEALALAQQVADACKALPESSPLRRTYEQHFRDLQAKVTVAASPSPGPTPVPGTR